MHDRAAQIDLSPDGHSIKVTGQWTVQGIATLCDSFVSSEYSHLNVNQINAHGLDEIDTSGAWLLLKLLDQLSDGDNKPRLIGLAKEQQQLFDLVLGESGKMEKLPDVVEHHNPLHILGYHVIEKIENFFSFMHFIGELCMVACRCVMKPGRIQLRSMLSTIDDVGFCAMPIVALMSFLIGVVLTYQMGVQLQQYDASIYIVDLSGLAVLREFGPLITAIIAAGRTATAFTSQIGTMKINEEIDALSTMGLSPHERLVLPKMLGILLALPLLIVWADVFGILGSMVMSNAMLSINFYDFLNRFQEVIKVQEFLVGIVKAPVFALVISSVGCYQGFQVLRGADSVGKMTTRSAVQAVFLIIIIDAVFSILFSVAGI